MNNDIVIIQLDRPRHLRLGHKAIKTMEKLLGKPIANMNTDSFTSDEMEKIMYSMMLKDAQDHGEDLKLGQMEELLDGVPYNTVIKALVDAFSAAFGDSTKNAPGIAENSAGTKA